MPYAYYFQLPVAFPAGLHPGAGSDANRLMIARDGLGQPVLNGSSVAGILRSVYRDHLMRTGDWKSGSSQLVEAVGRLFGFAYEGDRWQEQHSSVKVTNYELDMGRANVDSRTHHLRNRHRGNVVDAGLFSMESCPPGTSATIGLWVFDDYATTDEIEAFLGVIARAFQQGICLGGNSNRGIGLAFVDPAKLQFKRFDLSDVEQQARFLDSHHAWRDGKTVSGLEPFVTDSPGLAEHALSLEVSLCIPRGQDLLVAEGTEGVVGMEPQRVIAADGRPYWKLPGSTLRGAFRDWMNRLAATQEVTICDDSIQYQENNEGTETANPARRLTGENLGWCFVDPERRIRDEKSRSPTDCPVASLFGSLFAPGRIKISDGFAPCSTPIESDGGDRSYTESQQRTHVAVDRVTGGAAQGLLFSNQVLTAYTDGTSPEFKITIRIQDPVEREAQWLRAALVALDLGVIRIGSSKSSGRLALYATPRASGQFSELFADLTPSSLNVEASQ